MTSINYIAVDIAKDSFEVFSEFFKGSYLYTSESLKILVKQIRSVPSPLVVCEATGGYERELMFTLFKQKIPVARVNPFRVRAFAKSDGIKAKTDPIDASVLLRFSKEKNIKPTPPPSPKQQALSELMDRRSQLSGNLASEKNRLKMCTKRIQRSIEKMIRFTGKEIKLIEKQIKEIIKDDEIMCSQRKIMLQVKGVGETTVWSVLAYLSEITSLGRNQLVALAGVAPYNRDSGKWKGKRRIEGGRAKLRKCLYMAATSAAVHNPHIKAYVDGLRARGKPYKCAIVAAMRKLLVYMQSLLKSSQKELVS